MLILFATLVVASVVIYGAMYLAPGSALALLAGGHHLSPAEVKILSREYHLSDGFIAQWWYWFSNAVHGNLGYSIVAHQSVAALVRPRIPVTLTLIAMTTVLILLVALPLGVIGPVRGGRVDTSVVGLTAISSAVPSFVAATILIYITGVEFHWFPTFGSGGSETSHIYHLIVPACALAFANIGYMGRVVRSAVENEVTSEHVDNARVRGIPEHLVIRRHVVRNAMIPIMTVGSITAASLIAGAVIVENAFSLNGLGSLLITSVQAHDFPVVQAVCLIIVAVFVVLSAITDALYSLLDPRIGRSR